MSPPSLALQNSVAAAAVPAVAPPGALSGARRFLLHLAVMVALMYVGMIALDPLYSGFARLLGSANPKTDWPIASAVVMTAEMTIPMIPFMRWHGHSRRHITEMAGAMALPSVAAVVLYLAGAIHAQSVAGVGHAAMIPAMLGAMLYRRRDYSSPMPAPATTGGGAEVLDRPKPVTQEPASHARAFALAATKRQNLAARAGAGSYMQRLR